MCCPKEDKILEITVKTLDQSIEASSAREFLRRRGSVKACVV